MKDWIEDKLGDAVVAILAAYLWLAGAVKAHPHRTIIVYAVSVFLAWVF
jgi:hypothetical protein